MTSSRARLGELMIAEGVLEASALNRALTEQRRRGGKLGEVLLALGLISEGQLTSFLARQFHLSPVDLDAAPIPPDSVIARLPAELAHALGALPIAYREDERCLVIAVAEPVRGERLDRLREHAQCWILPRLSNERALREALRRTYGAPDRASPEARTHPLPTQRGPAPAAMPATLSHPEVRALVALLTRKGLITAAEVGRLFDAEDAGDAPSDPSRHPSEGTAAGTRPDSEPTRLETTT